MRYNFKSEQSQADIIFRSSVQKNNGNNENGLILNTQEVLFGPIWENVCTKLSCSFMISFQSTVWNYNSYKVKNQKDKNQLCLWKVFFFSFLSASHCYPTLVFVIVSSNLYMDWKHLKIRIILKSFVFIYVESLRFTYVA